MADGTIIIDVVLNEKEFKNSLENMGEITKSGADGMITAVEKLSGNFAVLPGVIASVMNTVPGIIDSVIGDIQGKNPVMAETGSGLFSSLTSNLSGIIRHVTEAVPEIAENIAWEFEDNGFRMSDAGFYLFSAIKNKLPQAKKELAKTPLEIVDMLAERFEHLNGQFDLVGENMIRGVMSGVNTMVPSLVSSVQTAMDKVLSATTKFLGISSPSKLFRDIVGKNIALGVKSGIDDEMGGVISGTKAQMSRLVSAAAGSADIGFGAADTITRANIQGARLSSGGARSPLSQDIGSSAAAMPEINITLEPSGDMRGFFDYIRMGIKRSAYLNGEE